MKLAFAALLLVLVACNQADKTDTTTTEFEAPGAYKMLDYSLKGSTTDTTDPNPNQLKIFTGEHMMYANTNDGDSIGSFGIATYDVEGDTLTEFVMFTASDSTVNDTVRTYKLAITKNDKGYKQVITGMQGDTGELVTLTENYESVGTNDSTDLDGAWRLIKAFSITGTDTIDLTTVQYKVYYDGHVMWGTTWKDSLQRNHTAVGYGTFKMKGNKSTEKMVNSSMSTLKGRDFEVEIEMMGADGFKQTMHHTAEGSRTVEVYERLKRQ